MKLSLTRFVSPVVVLVAACCLGQDSEPPGGDADAEKEAIAKFRAYAKEIATAYDLRAGDRDKRALKLIADPVLRWTNPLGGQRARGEIYLWTDAGVPAAIVSINEFTDAGGRLHGEQEWCSLAAGPIVADGPHHWSPAAGILSPRPLRDVEPPAGSATRRMRQIRELAERFKSVKTTRAGVDRALRLLAQPLYRYESKDAGLLDGAVFAFAEATDPEVLLVLEARSQDATHVWHFAFARMNSVHLVATCDGKPCWEAPALEGRDVYDRTDKAYSAFLRK